ncbi:amidohydrolase [Jatrophihabitans telluris]|uniref:Amidohydrolase n=1 Tax=Jatrophihabitans telluris TaxID=2038343 RepID=A0ABY4QZH7_9ACTN|nr:amidohydrolase family protein [Jatrophihabitans telluris]UQX88970.1 amidohydrolase [Jatrophihabitans telluris]
MNHSTGPTIDMHAHVGTPACEPLVAGLFSTRMDPFTHFGGPETVDYNRAHFNDIRPRLVDPALRLDDMDAMGIDIQALSVAPPQFYYWADPELGRRLARMQNEHLAEITTAHPHRFVGLATVPLQDVAGAIAELEYAVRSLGFRGAEICTNVNGLDLDDRRFRPFFAKASELDVVILLHPHGFSQGDRLTEYYLSNVIGNPLDSTVALTRIILGGVLEELPNLKLCFVHGGGYLPFYSPRMDHAYAERPESRHLISRTPSSYLSQVYVDGLVYDAPHLRFLIDRMGADHVVLGTDYPFDMGHYDPLGQLGSVMGLTDAERNQVRGETAAKLLGIS